MNNQVASKVSVAIVLFAAVATVALRAAARRPVPRTEPAPVMVTAGPPGPPGRPAGVVEQTQHVFHELHADGCNAFCAVCDGQYGSALGRIFTRRRTHPCGHDR
jgi:hypothetical protein